MKYNDYRKQQEPTSVLEVIAFIVVTGAALIFITAITFATALSIVV
jgi:hypothetical protein